MSKVVDFFVTVSGSGSVLCAFSASVLQRPCLTFRFGWSARRDERFAVLGMFGMVEQDEKL